MMSNEQQSLADLFSSHTQRLAPRLLTQVCRDPSSPAYGCCDRNWWHYKIRDFPSIILQQTTYTIACLADQPEFSEIRPSLREIAAAGARFWNRRARKHGAFEEYYPWEQGYPPLAFSTLAITKLAALDIVSPNAIRPGIDIARKQLLHRFESQATNQQCAGLAAVAWLRKLDSSWIPEKDWVSLRDRTLACQHSEGWFMEYGGPDLGYLSVTLDCLWDAYDASGETLLLESAAKALHFIAAFVDLPGRGAGMHNARNTDYIVPYGIARFLETPEHRDTAVRLIDRLYRDLNHPSHFLHAIDDRYIGHYIGHSFIRALPLIRNNAENAAKEPRKFLPDIETANPITEKPDPKSRYYPGTGHWLLPETPSSFSALVSGKKGGIFTLWRKALTLSDYGWIVRDGKRVWASHWWMDNWTVAIDEDEHRLAVRGYLTPHTEAVSTPFKHLVLRGLSLIFGRRVIAMLKQHLIFKRGADRSHPFTRTITFEPDAVHVCDTLGIKESLVPERAPRSSKRHVASADSYHLEDMTLTKAEINCSENRKYQANQWEIETVYQNLP